MVLVSLIIIFGTLLVCDTLRGLLHKLDPSTKHFSIRISFDVLVTIEFIAVAFELGVILENYGLWIWLIGLFCNVLYQCLRWRGLTLPSPVSHFQDFLAGKKKLQEVIIRTAVILTTGWATYTFYILPIWSLELSSHHIGRPEAFAAESCTVPWHSVPVWKSVAAEFVGSLFLGIAPGLIIEHPTLTNNDPLYTAAIIGVLVCLAVVSVMEISGGMFNPLLATILFGGCKGHSIAEHIYIYWLGAMGGSLLAFFIYPTVKNFFYPQQAETFHKEPLWKFISKNGFF